MGPRLQQKYTGEIRPKLMEEFGIENVNAVPRMEKISINMGIGKARENQKHLDDAMRDLGLIASAAMFLPGVLLVFVVKLFWTEASRS